MASTAWSGGYRSSSEERVTGFLMDVKPRTWYKPEKQAGVELYFQNFDGEYVSCFMIQDPYFYVLLNDWSMEKLVRKKIWSASKDDYGKYTIKDIEKVRKHVCRSLNDHFHHEQDALQVFTSLPRDVSKLREKVAAIDAVGGRDNVRESKIPYHHRVMIDWGLNIGKAYDCLVDDQGFVEEFSGLEKNKLPSIPEKCTFDIEIMKQPLKKPKIGDPVNLIGYKYVKDGFMLNNLSINCAPIDDFWFGVKDGMASPLTEEEAKKMLKSAKYKPIFFRGINLKDEKETLNAWKEFLIKESPKVYGGYNSDAFDWKQIIENAKKIGIDFDDFFTKYDKYEQAYDKDGHINIDAFDFINRDSYLSKGNRGLKNVSKKLLGVEPLEIDHEETVKLLKRIQNEYTNPEHPNYDMEKAKIEVQNLAYYCASDVLVTAILLENHVINLDLSLSSILPMTVFESSRKKRGAMVELMFLKRWHERGMIAPNKVTKEGSDYFNPVKDGLLRGKEVFQEVTVKGEKKLARCVTKDWLDKNCGKCGDLDRCKMMARDAITRNKHFRCDKKKEYIIPAPKAKLPVEAYKFEGAYVDVFNRGIFKDNCPLDIPIKVGSMSRVEKKMKHVLLKKVKEIQQKGWKVGDITPYLKEIEEKFDLIRSKSILSEDGTTYLYNGLIALVHIDVASMYPSLITNYNLQPYGVVTPLMCKTCPHRYEKGDACCWVELPWNAVYDIIMLPPKLYPTVYKKFKNVKMDKKKKIEAIKKMIRAAIKDKTIEKPRRIKGSYTTHEVARFCQKARKDFVDAVSEFRSERYKYKYGEKSTFKKIEKIEESWKESMTPELKEKVAKLRKRAKMLEKRVKDYKDHDEDKNSEEVQKFVDDIKSINDDIGKTLNGWMDQKPQEIQDNINALEIEKIYNRNAQLTYKVILNSIYGWLKSIGARLWCIEVTGCTTMSGQTLIKWVVNYTVLFSLPIELDTDGVWEALPVDFPLVIEMKLYDKDDKPLLDKEGNERTEEINLFNSIVNADVKKEFTNYNNYEWDEETNTYVNIPKCDISFDYDGPYSTFVVQAKKRYVAYERDRKDPRKQNIAEMKGLDQKRKGELGLLKNLEELVFNEYRDGLSYDDCYGSALKIVKERLDGLRTGSIDLDFIYEARDITTVAKVQEAISIIHEKEMLKKYDPSEVPISASSIGASDIDGKIKMEMIKALKASSVCTRQGMGALRMADMGIEIEDGDPVQWVISKYPRNAGVTERIIPTLLFDAEISEMKKYLKRWLGHDFLKDYSEEALKAESVDWDYHLKLELIDWDYYLERFMKKIYRIVINLYKDQKKYTNFDMIKELGLESSKTRTRSKGTRDSTSKSKSKARSTGKKSFNLESFI